MRPTVLALIALSLVGSEARAVSPSMRGIKPVGGQRGTEVEVTITGQRLGDAREVLFYQPGVTVTKIRAVKDDQITATFRVAADARLGLHDFRLRTATGVSALKTFSVGALKDVTEAEPNNDFARPQAIPMNVTVNGVADNEDIDYYAVTVKKGDRITAEVEGIRLGLTLFDPYVAILDARRFELASSDDAPLAWQDGFVSLVAPADGTYVVAVRESAYAGNANCLYRLHVGDFPRPRATVPLGGKLGAPVTVRWIGDVRGETTTTLTLPDRAEREFGLLAHDAAGTAPYPNPFRLSPFDNATEHEPDETPAAATAFTAPAALNGVIGAAGDVDRFVFDAKKGQRFDVRVYARRLRSPLDPVLTITQAGGGTVAANDDSGGPDSYVRFAAPKDGSYVVSVTDHLRKGGPDYGYRVEVTPVVPSLTLSTPSESLRRGTGVMAVAVPRGNRQAILINASRNDFGGALTLAASNLPAGVRFESDAMSANNTTVPVVFTAAADAPPAATLANVSGRPVDSSLDVRSEFTSTAELVLGQNNQPFWTRTVESLAVAVTEEAPFSVEAVEPKVPIVRGGSMELKVLARRRPGFTAPIAVSLPWNPPGISSKADTVIPENQNEARILVNAAGGAPLATWKVVVNGTYTEPPPAGAPAQGNRRGGFGRGRLTVSSPLTKLTVAPQFVTLKFDAASVEQGKDVDLAVHVSKAVDFPGEATVTLLGLPFKVTTAPAKITRDSTEVVFHLQTDRTTPAGEAKNLFCQVVVTRDGEPIVHNLGTGRLRVDTPLPAKPAAGKPVATAAKPGGAAARPLGRLEKLRQEARDRVRAATEGTR